MTRSWAEVVGCPSLRVTVPPRSPSGCCKGSNANIGLDPALQSQFALLRTEILQLVAVRIEEVARPLREEAAKFKLLLARVTESMGRADLFASCESYEQEPSVVVDDDVVDMMASKVDDEAINGKAHGEADLVGEECFFGCLSPRVSPSPQHDVSVAPECEGNGGIMPVIQIMPDLQELCEDPSPPLSMVHHQADSLVISEVASAPPPVEASRCSDKVMEADVLAPNSDALFASELCDLLARLEVASPGSSKEIARLLEEKSSRGKIQKVKDYLGSKSKKNGATRKESAVG